MEFYQKGWVWQFMLNVVWSVSLERGCLSTDRFFIKGVGLFLNSFNKLQVVCEF